MMSEPTRPANVQEAMSYVSRLEIHLGKHKGYLGGIASTIEKYQIGLAAYIRELEQRIKNMEQGKTLLECVGDCFDDLKNNKIKELEAERDRLKAELEKVRGIEMTVGDDKKMLRWEKGFICGVAWAAAYMMGSHGEESYARWILQEAGCSEEDLIKAGVEQCDIDSIGAAMPKLAAELADGKGEKG